MSAPALWNPPPSPAPARPVRLSPAALGRLSDAELSFLADNSTTPTTRVAALLVLIGRATAADVLTATNTE